MVHHLRLWYANNLDIRPLRAIVDLLLQGPISRILLPFRRVLFHSHEENTADGFLAAVRAQAFFLMLSVLRTLPIQMMIFSFRGA
mgnify:CR=1 FL=1